MVYSIEDLALTHLMQNFHDGFNAEREGINQWQINNIDVFILNLYVGSKEDFLKGKTGKVWKSPVFVHCF